MRFVWDEDKRRKNLRTHGIDLAEAGRIFDGPVLVDLDTRFYYGEERWIAIGMINDGTIVVVYVELEPEDDGDVEVYRIISAREATTHERRKYHERR